MVATKLLISVCVIGLASAAPQAQFQGQQQVSQQTIVSDVVTSLQPSIAKAVADALRGLSTASSSTSDSRFSTSSGSSSGFGSGATVGGNGASFAGAAVSPAAAPAQYNFQYQIADELEQTYISQNEARDGNDVTGTYSYVDPNGDLVRVVYEAGLNGYSETREKQVGAVEIRAKPARNQATNAAGAGATVGQQQQQQVFRPQPVRQQQNIDQSALISQIIAALQPQISTAVNSAVNNL